MDTTPRFNDPDNTLLKKICLLLQGGISSGVLSFNARSGAVTLLSSDVTNALGYTPVNKAGDTMSGDLTAPALNVGGTTSSFPSIKRSGALLRVRLADDSNYAIVQSGFLQANVVDAGTNTQPVAFEIYHETSGGNGAANDGVSMDLRADSSTTDRQLQIRISSFWEDATHATRTAHVRITPTLNGTSVEALRISNAQVSAQNGTVFAVSGTKVVGTRQTGWTAATGTATRSTFVTSTVTLEVLAQHVKALIDDLITHGLIGA
jgi:hypothetical protein